MKILFILKKRSSYGISYGLVNSCKFVSRDLKDNFDIDSKIVEVIDTTFIDREVHSYKPDVVVLEALWAEARRLPQIFKLHPHVKKWNCRIHSKTGFLVNEGEALHMIQDYHEISKSFPKFTISGNNLDFINEIFSSLKIKLDYLPNIYPFNFYNNTPKDTNKRILDIGCFGALRPFKNQVIQAQAAIKFANDMKQDLNFHINGDRQEQRGENVYKNLVNLFKNQKNHHLISHDWSNHILFLHLVRKMDIGMQVSFNESFNIVAADFVSQGVPIVGSDEIKFLLPFYQAEPNSINDIVKKLKFAYYMRAINFQNLNKILLENSNKRAEEAWLNYLF